MPAGLAIPLLIAGGASAASSIGGAVIASKGAKKAAQTQATSAQEALAALERNRQEAQQVYQQGMQGVQGVYEPYMRLGTDSLAQIYRGLGLGEMPTPPPVTRTPPPGMYPPGGGMPPGGAQMRNLPNYGGRGVPTPLGGYEGGAVTTPLGQRPNTLGAINSGAQPPGAGGMVMLRAPNGQTKAVPAALAPHYLAKGAVRVG